MLFRSTLNYIAGNNTVEPDGYTFTISDVRLFSIFTATGISSDAVNKVNSAPILTNGTNVSKTVIGTILSLTATGVNTLFGSNTALYATLIVEGRNSGARLSIPVTINKTSQSV